MTRSAIRQWAPGAEEGGIVLELPRIVAIIGGFAKCEHAGEMDEWFKSHAWKACVGS